MTRTASQIIVDEVTSWPGMETAIGDRGELSLRLGRREIGHLHGDHAAHFGFPRQVAAELRDAGRIGPHPAFPDNPGWGARRIRDEADVADVIAILRQSYDRAVARHGVPDSAVARHGDPDSAVARHGDPDSAVARHGDPETSVR